MREHVLVGGTHPPSSAAARADLSEWASAADRRRLADVGAVEEHVDRRRQLLEALDDGLQRLQLAGGISAPICGDLLEAVEVVEDDEALEQWRAGRGGCRRRAGRAAARRRCSRRSARRARPGREVEAGEDRVHDLAADVLEVDVDPVGGRGRRAACASRPPCGRRPRRSRAARSSSAHFSGPPAMPTTRAPSASRAGRRPSRRAGGRRDDDRLALLRLADVADPDQAVSPRHPQHPEEELGETPSISGTCWSGALLGGDEVLGPADQALDSCPSSYWGSVSTTRPMPRPRIVSPIATGGR